MKFLKTLTCLLIESFGFEKDIRDAESMGFEYITKAEAGDMVIGLFKTLDDFYGKGPFYQISLNRKGFSFINDQHNDDVPVDKNFIKTFRAVEQQIVSWMKEYNDKPHFIGSLNEDKLFVYHKMLNRFSKEIEVGDVEGIYFEIRLKP